MNTTKAVFFVLLLAALGGCASVAPGNAGVRTDPFLYEKNNP